MHCHKSSDWYTETSHSKQLEKIGTQCVTPNYNLWLVANGCHCPNKTWLFIRFDKPVRERDIQQGLHHLVFLKRKTLNINK